jgi:hypothetical protein
MPSQASQAATAQCNGAKYLMQPFRDESAWESFKEMIAARVNIAFGGKLAVPGFFVNGDPRGYALKIDNETPEGKALIQKTKMHTDWGGYGILSPEITGDY